MWSVTILGLIKMLLKTVSFDHLALYLISEEHNLKKKTKTPNSSDHEKRCLVPSLEQTTLGPSQGRKGLPGSASAALRKHSMSLKAELRQIRLRLSSKSSPHTILLTATWRTV